MSYTETGEVYTYFSGDEDTLIRDWLTKHGYTWWQPTVCGNCCGFYNDEYLPNGIGGKMKPKDVELFKKYAAKHSIGCEVDTSGRITAQ